MDKGAWLRLGAAAAAVAAISLGARAAAREILPWHDLVPRLYYIPVVFAALRDGWRGGVLLAALAGLALFFVVSTPGASVPHLYVEIASLCLVGALTGWLADRERRQKQRYRDVAEQLSAVYAKLQANFEGMKRAERLSAIGTLSAGLAHEIRNPLASIAGAAAIHERGAASGGKYARCIEIIRHESQRLNDLLTNFLSFARPRPPRFRAVDLHTVLDNVISLAGHAAGRRNVPLGKSAAPDLPAVECDPEQLEQVLLNLLINAVEASPDGAAVTLSAEVAGGQVNIRVTDQGCGVPPADVDKLFDPFFTTKEHGTGLGLPVAHQIVRQMGGTLAAAHNPDRGMTFSVALPLERSSL
jgi:signal transduction histidine kinase